MIRDDEMTAAGCAPLLILAALLALISCQALGDVLAGPAVESPEYLEASAERDAARERVEELARLVEEQEALARDAQARMDELAGQLAEAPDPERVRALELVAESHASAMARLDALQAELDAERETLAAAAARADAPPGEALGDAAVREGAGWLSGWNPLFAYLLLAGGSLVMREVRERRRS